MKPKAYLETTVVSYLTALPSRDLLVAAHQQVTREWWEGRDAFDVSFPSWSWMRHRPAIRGP